MPVPVRPQQDRGPTAEFRLPWWGVALPVLAFAVLLLVLLNPDHAHATVGEPALAQLLDRVRQAVTG
ncbi:hypothetical protein [Streptomyces sp. NPDC058045]|uniref:hypothetical protein n=1 Tax=Streptomyces sp. NPDC058045 TaxID=3346311 RepID=UPI0036E4317A